MYKEIVSSLEKWIEDPEASTEPYIAMRRAYPSGQSHAANKNEASSDRLVVCVMSGMLSEAVVFFTSQLFCYCVLHH